MTPAGIRGSERVQILRTGGGHYRWHEDMGEVSEYRLQLDWIPVALKNRSRTMWNAKAGKILHFRDKKVQIDIDAIRAIWLKVDPKPPVCALRMEMVVTVNRPMSKAEVATSHWNQRRGDLVSSHELLCDALEGCWYESDSQITKLTIEERRECVTPSVLIVGRPRA